MCIYMVARCGLAATPKMKFSWSGVVSQVISNHGNWTCELSTIVHCIHDHMTENRSSENNLPCPAASTSWKYWQCMLLWQVQLGWLPLHVCWAVSWACLALLQHIHVGMQVTNESSLLKREVGSTSLRCLLHNAYFHTNLTGFAAAVA